MPSIRPPKKVREPLAPAGCGDVANGTGLPGLRACHLVMISIATVSGTLAIAMLPVSIPSTISGAPHRQYERLERGLWPFLEIAVVVVEALPGSPPASCSRGTFPSGVRSMQPGPFDHQ